MVNLVTNSTTINTGVIYDLEYADTLFVGPAALVSSRDTTVILADSFGNGVTVAGTVSGVGRGISLGSRNAPGLGNDRCSLTVLESGSVIAQGTSASAVGLSGLEHAVTNAGTLSGAFGIMTGIGDTNPATDAVISNSGKILAGDIGIAAISFTGSIANSGLISVGASPFGSIFNWEIGTL